MTEGAKRVAVIDVGTNSTRLLVADVADGRVSVLERRSTVTRLGRGVDLSGRLASEAIEDVCAAIGEYVGIIEELEVETVDAIATSAVRDADNGSAFIAELRERFALSARVLDGEEEARSTYLGATSEDLPTEPTLVVDIGGGSTELVLGDASGPVVSQSMDIGSVRLHERHLADDPPTPEQVRACVDDIDAHLDACPVPVATAGTVVGVAGTVLSITAGVLDLATYDKGVLDQSVVAVDDVHAFVERLVAMPVARRLEFGWMHPGRVDVLGAGGLILARVLARCATTSLVASEADILDGIAWSM
ncbi:MAG TPA: hypothetical protein VLI94_12700, partial [Solirubrobacterales bacterium]|nr:hypothetical protein [Solirubrobacterales bacterium]